MAYVNTIFIILAISTVLTHEVRTLSISMYEVQLKHRKAKVPVLKDHHGHSVVQGLQQRWNIFSQEFLRTDQIVTGSLGVSPELQLFPSQLIVLFHSN